MKDTGGHVGETVANPTPPHSPSTPRPRSRENKWIESIFSNVNGTSEKSSLKNVCVGKANAWSTTTPLNNHCGCSEELNTEITFTFDM